MADIPYPPRAELYPEIEPYSAGTLKLDGVHAMYWEQSGNPEGAPVLFLHGGPGAGASPAHRRFFDPAHYRIVIFDQRGAGRSTPLGELRDNTTLHLVADIERLRTHLGIERWLVFGGSWGSTLALAYGEAHPERCAGFILRGVFLCRGSEIDWFLYGLRALFPEAWRTFAEIIPAPERGDLLAAYYRRLA
ncbi:MAG: alpha/beta fold hydrolase, partial [Burkholderiales bacterium]